MVVFTFYYFCIDDIFSENSNSECKTPIEPEINTQNIAVKISEEYNAAIKKICEKIYHKPEDFINKAIKCQWECIKSDVDAGYYHIIDDFCNIPKIKKALEKVVKKLKTNKELAENENVKKVKLNQNNRKSLSE